MKENVLNRLLYIFTDFYGADDFTETSVDFRDYLVTFSRASWEVALGDVLEPWEHDRCHEVE